MALIDIVNDSIGEVVSILHQDEEHIEGKLIGIDTSQRPDDYPCFLKVQTSDRVESIPINWIKQFFRKSWLQDPNTEYFYIVLRYGKTERSKEHIYMSYDYNIKPGDQVLVWRDWLYVGNVIRTGFFKRDDAPYPVEKTWLIEKQVFPRIDFLQYPEAPTLIKADNLYKDKALNSDNDHRQFLAASDEQYQWLVDFNNEFLESRKPKLDTPEDLGKYIVGMTEWELDGGWDESNQIDVFYKTLWICSLLAQCGSYNKFYFDKYLCLSLLYKHGDLDAYMLDAEYDKTNIERDVRIVDIFLETILQD